MTNHPPSSVKKVRREACVWKKEKEGTKKNVPMANHILIKIQ